MFCIYPSSHERICKSSKIFVVSSRKTPHWKQNHRPSIQKCQYPDSLKISKVIALFKKGNKRLAQNYRPISLLDVFDKIFERLLHSRLIDFLNKMEVFFEFQFGYRDGHSTILVLTDIIDNIKQNIDKNEFTIGIFIDLTKAFDTVDHKILVEKLRHYGIRGNALSLLTSYLHNRK